MNKTICIYYAGSIQKGHEQNEFEWTEKNIEEVTARLKPFTHQSLNPAFRSDDLSDQQSVFGRDMAQVYLADFIFVDARAKRGLGVGAEMMWAKYHQKPVITWAPENTHYKKDRTSILGVEIEHFVHPFVYGLSDAIVSTLEEGVAWMKNYILHPSEIKDFDTVKKCMKYYNDTQLQNDKPMQDIIGKMGNIGGL